MRIRADGLSFAKGVASGGANSGPIGEPFGGGPGQSIGEAASVPVRALLFLDWDLEGGVLGGGDDGQGAVDVARAYAAWLLPVVQAFGAGVVLTGERRHGMPLAMLAAEFGVLAPHVVGVTPRLHGPARGRREREIEAFLVGQGEQTPRAWVAVDATVHGFVRLRRHLFALRRDRGLQERDIESLKRRMGRMVEEARVLAEHGLGQ